MSLMEMNIRNRIEEWVNEFISPYCSTCKDNCCNATKHMINIRKEEPAVKFFSGIGLKIYMLNELDLPSVKNWMRKRLAGKVLTKDKVEVFQPSLIETPIQVMKGKRLGLSTTKTDYVLYAKGYCPLYEKRKGCLIYGDPRRPQACKEYPLTFCTDNQDSVINIHNFCPSMRTLEMKKQLKFYFPDSHIITLSELLGDHIMNSNKKKLKMRRR